MPPIIYIGLELISSVVDLELSIISLGRARRRRRKMRWARALPQEARRTIHTTYAVEDAGEGLTMSDTRRSTAFECVASSEMAWQISPVVDAF